MGDADARGGDESEDRVAALVAALTLEERATLTAGDDAWHTRAVPRLGIPRLKVTDGPNGARGDGVSGATATCFPVGTALAASWDTDLLARVGMALAAEARSKGARVLLGPTVNLQRTPLGGRNFECYSEDPLLTGRLAAAYIRGLQDAGVGACIKHYAANDSEHERFTISSEVDEVTLRELVLRPFEMAVAEADPWTVMAAYNRIGGTYACEHRELLTGVLRDEWGWDGVVISDWGAVHSDWPTLAAGCDLEMPGPGRHLGPRLVEGEGDGPRLVEGEGDGVSATDGEALVTEAARRILGLVDRAGRLDDPVDPVTGVAPDQPERSDDPAEHRALAREAAVAGMVLLRNEADLLPLDTAALRRVAVIGPCAERGTFQGGGSSQVLPHRVSHPLPALAARLGPQVAVDHEPGSLIHRFLPELLTDQLDGDDDGRPVHLTVFGGPDFAGAPLAERRLRTLQARLFAGRMPGLDDAGTFGARYRATLVPRRSGLHTFGLSACGQARLLVDGAVVVDNWTAPRPGEWFYGFGTEEVTGAVDLEAGAPVELVVEYGRSGPALPVALRVGLLEPAEGDLLDRAVTAAAAADAAVVVVGTTGEWETEGNDRETMALPGDQDELIRRVAAAQANTVVVVNAGSPVDVRSWLHEVPAVLQVWFPGQAFGEALAAVLTGDAEPGGRLPTTLPWRLEDCPALAGGPRSYPGADGRVVYTEGPFLGYRGYDHDGTTVAFPFGHGLGYTTWSLRDLAVEPTDAEATGITVGVTVTNTGRRPGHQVVQCYLSPPPGEVPRPPRELAAFTKVHLGPGEERRVALTLDRRAVTRWEPGTGWTVLAGRWTVAVGSSSRDLPLSAPLDVAG